MREIKYNAYDKKNEMMFYDIQNWIDFEDESHYKFSDFLQENERWEVVQYTWLRDKNKKEIYEGNIIKWKWNTYIVVFEHASFKLKTIDDSAPDYIPIYENRDRIEIIWNIYENPELLNM
jgi:hypothetical protein